MSRHKKPFSFDALENREVPAVFGLPWGDASSLTLSFAPDGTKIGGLTSNLDQQLNKAYGGDAWRTEILRAIQSWAVDADINIGLVSDNGSDFGVAGAPQGDKRFGDIRIGGAPLGADVLAVTVPPGLQNGTWAGDIIVNTNKVFSLDSSKGWDLYTALLHEAGHALGLPGECEPSSAMNDYANARSALASLDVCNIVELYGERAADSYESSGGNDSLVTARSLWTMYPNTDIRRASASLSRGDVDWYKFQMPSNSTSAQITLHTAGLSLLVGEVALYGDNNKLIATRSATNPLDADRTWRVDNLTAGASYHVRVQAAPGDAFGVGRYDLVVDTKPLADASLEWNRVDDYFSNTDATIWSGITVSDLRDSFTSLTTFNSDRESHESYKHFKVVGVNFADHAPWEFRLRSIDDVDSQTLVLRASAIDNVTNLNVVVMDSAKNVIATTKIDQVAGTLTLRVDGIVADQDYFVRVESPITQTTSYRLSADFTTVDLNQSTTVFNSAVLNAKTSVVNQTVAINESGVYQFNLLTTTKSTIDSAVLLSIYDSSNRVVGRKAVRAGGALRMELALSAGTYRFEVSAATASGAKLPNINYTLLSTVLSDPIGPYYTDPTYTVGPTPAPSLLDPAVYTFYSTTYGAMSPRVSPYGYMF